MDHIERYQELREAQSSVNNRLLDTLPEGQKGGKVLIAAARELGYEIVNDHTAALPSEAAIDRLYEFLLYEPGKTGKSRAQKLIEAEYDLDPDEEMVLRAAVASETSLYQVVAVDKSNATLRLHDLLRDRPDVTITDFAMSETARVGYLFFLRVIEIPEVSFCSGAAMAFLSEEKAFLLKKCKRLMKIRNPLMRSRKRYILFSELDALIGAPIEYT